MARPVLLRRRMRWLLGLGALFGIASIVPGCAEEVDDEAVSSAEELVAPGSVTLSQDANSVTFTNADGAWVIYKKCIGPKQRNGADLTVGPGYIARLTLKKKAADGRNVIVDDERPLRGTPNDPITHGTLSSPGHGGLGAFGWHHARGRAPFTFGDNNTWELTGRHCAEDNGNFGVSEAKIVSPATIEADGGGGFAIDVFFTDGYTFPAPLMRVRYKYRVLATSVRMWASVTQLCPNGECGLANGSPGPAYIKEPKFLTAVVGGGYRRMTIFDDKNQIGDNSSSPNGTCMSRTTDPRKATAQCDADTRVRARFDYGTKDSGTDGACDNDEHPCLNTVMHAYPVESDGDILRSKKAALWENGTIGPDAWALRSVDRQRVHTEDSKNGNAQWACHGGSTGAATQRRWEMGTWQKADGTFDYGGFGFHAWEGGTGAYDCEPLTRRFGPSGESFGIRAQFAINEGWRLDL